MPLTLGTNIASLKVLQGLSKASAQLEKTSSRLASGMRINTASDDAAGLAISNSLTADVRIAGQAIRNINDGISMLSIAEGALTEMTSILQRHAELAEQAANGSYSTSQREALNSEANSLVAEYNRIVSSTTFNGIQLFQEDGNGQVSLHIGTNANSQITVSLGQKLVSGTNNGYLVAAGNITNIGQRVLTLADVNHDGIMDTIGTTTGFRLAVALGNGDGSFNNATTYTGIYGSVSQDIDYISTGDINGDGNIDIVATRWGRNYLGVYLGNADGSFQAAVSYANPNSSGYTRVADFDNDGLQDIIVGSGIILLNNGNGTFESRTGAWNHGANTQGIVSGDFNNDGVLDILATSLFGGLHVNLGVGDGSFTNPFNIGTGTTGQLTDIVAADLNNDGNLDVVLNRNDNQIRVMYGTGNGNFVAGQLYAGNNPDLIDYTGDGIVDILTTNSGNTLVYAGNGDGTFSAPLTSNGVLRGHAIGDINGDGAVDMFSGGAAGTHTLVYGGVRKTQQLKEYNLMTQNSARTALDKTKAALEKVTSELGNIGAFTSRLNVASQHMSSIRSSYQEALSRITDADIATETSEYIKYQIIQQAAVAVLAQANQNPQLVLKLLRSEQT